MHKPSTDAFKIMTAYSRFTLTSTYNFSHDQKKIISRRLAAGIG